MIQKLILFAGCMMLLTSLAGCVATSTNYSYDYSDPPYLYSPYWYDTHYGKRSNYHRHHHHQHHGQHHNHSHGARSHPSHHRR